MTQKSCSNRQYGRGHLFSGSPCSRAATGDDGLCNVCRAAKIRGARRRAESATRFTETMRQIRQLDAIMKAVYAYEQSHDEHTLLGKLREILWPIPLPEGRSGATMARSITTMVAPWSRTGRRVTER